MRLATPWALAALVLLLPVVYRLIRRPGRGVSRLSLPLAGERLRALRNPWIVINGWLPWMRLLAAGLMILAIARPQAESRLETIRTLGVDIVIALDVSNSMRGEDFQPDHRLGVAKQMIEQFVAGRTTDRIGLVAFSRVASTRCPLTLDHTMLAEFLGQVDFATRELDGTAIGIGLATAVHRLRDSEAKSRLVVLLTDGENNTGQIAPRDAADAAKALGIRVYTIGVGSNDWVTYVNPDNFGGRRQRQRFPLDEETLKEIAERTDGEYFNAKDPDGLKHVFETIDQLEKTEIESRERILYAELFHWFLLPALITLFLERLLSSTRLRKIP
ncbi:MAG: VWA domain-containing protein [Acidobacteriota bacterium]|nr:VWA domain-containing protein [Acidobacteriota bacterium]MDH3785886.1 VWA domain-containing protein [Acidobacteriota bacterium]